MCSKKDHRNRIKYNKTQNVVDDEGDEMELRKYETQHRITKQKAATKRLLMRLVMTTRGLHTRHRQLSVGVLRPPRQEGHALEEFTVAT